MINLKIHLKIYSNKKLTSEVIMKKRTYVILVVGLSLALFIMTTSSLMAKSPDASLLTVSDVAKVTGVQGLKMVPKDPDPKKHMIGDINFIRPDGTRILSVTFETVDLKEFAKTKKTDSWKSAFRGPVKGVGDEAYDGPPNMEPFILSVRKGTHWMTISTMFDIKKGMKPILTQEQLKKIAEIIINNGKW